MGMPNKFNNRISGIFSLWENYTFFRYNHFLNLVKTQIPLNGYGIDTLILFKFVWRQLEFAFFGALTSVGALFYFLGGKNESNKERLWSTKPR